MTANADYDVVIAGGGHNALICACVLAKNGLSVCVLERNPWVGGGVVTREVTLPGYKHDLFGSSHVWIHLNPDFMDIRPELEKHGLKYIWSDDHITGHPNRFEGQGIIVQGTLGADGVFNASQVLAKHDENYMPPELADMSPNQKKKRNPLNYDPAS